MMTIAEQKRMADLEARVAELEFLREVLIQVRRHVGLDETTPVSPPEPMGQVLSWRGTSKRVAGSAVPQTAPRRASTPGVAS